MFNEKKRKKYLTKFQLVGLTIGIFTNKKIANFFDRNLIFYQSIFKRKIHNSQMHYHKQTCWKKKTQFVNSKPPMKYTKILSFWNEKNIPPIFMK